MKTNRFTTEQIFSVLKEAEAGMPVKELCRKFWMTKHHLVIDDATDIGFRKTKFRGSFSVRVPCNTVSPS